MSDAARALIITPNRGFAQYIQTLLARADITSTWAQDSSAALTSVRATEPALVICTQCLADREGLDVFSDLQASASPPPFILLSAEHSPHLKRRAEDAGVTSVFWIPFGAEDFLHAAHEAVRAADGEDHLKDQ